MVDFITNLKEPCTYIARASELVSKGDKNVPSCLVSTRVEIQPNLIWAKVQTSG
jgi:hypothetical protein